MDGDGVTQLTGPGPVARPQMQAPIALSYRIPAVFQRLYVEDWRAIQDMRSWMNTVREELREFKLGSIWGHRHRPDARFAADGVASRAIAFDDAGTGRVIFSAAFPTPPATRITSSICPNNE